MHTDFTYDEDGDMLFEANVSAGGTTTAKITYKYDSADRPWTETDNLGVTTSVTWDANSRLNTFVDSTGTTSDGAGTTFFDYSCSYTGALGQVAGPRELIHSV